MKKEPASCGHCTQMSMLDEDWKMRSASLNEVILLSTNHKTRTVQWWVGKETVCWGDGHSGAGARARLHVEHLNRVCVNSLILPLCLQMSLPPAVRFADFFVFFSPFFSSVLGSIDRPIYQITPAGWCQVNCNIGLKPQREKKNKTQPNHCQEIGVIVSWLVSLFHLRNRTGLLIAQGQSDIWDAAFERLVSVEWASLPDLLSD